MTLVASIDGSEIDKSFKLYQNSNNLDRFKKAKPTVLSKVLRDEGIPNFDWLDALLGICVVKPL